MHGNDYRHMCKAVDFEGKKITNELMKAKETCRHILNLVCADVWGGGEQYVYDLCAELKKRSLTSYVAVDQTNRDFQQRYGEVASVLCTDFYRLHGLLSIRYLAKEIREKGIGTVYCHSGKMIPLCLILKKMTGVKLIFFKHNTVPAKFDRYHRYVRKNTDATICVSRLVYELQVTGLSEIEKKKFHLVYNGINPERFNQYEFKSGNAQTFIIGYAGRIAAGKGIEILMAAIKEVYEMHQNVRLYLAGADEDNYYCHIKNYMKQDRMEGYVSYFGLVKDMERFYKELDALVLPSTAKEAFGLVLCEAMYCGVPVITGASGAQSEIITDQKNGILLHELTIQTVKMAILSLFDDPQKRERLAQEGRITVLRNFTIDKTVGKILEIQKSLQ